MSSSAITVDFVPGRKLLVNVAENGQTFEFECDESTPVEAVQRSIESLCGVQLNDQLLLCLDKKLESQRPLSFYKLPHDGREVFLYNRLRLHVESPPPNPETINIPDIVDPPTPSSIWNPHPLDDASDPALKALPSYERQFRYHFQRGHAIFGRTQVKFEACQRLLKEQRVQEKALETARGSMDQGYRVVHQMFEEFIRCYSQQHRHHSDLLANFGKDIERLRLCHLHPALQTETRKCLLDFVKEENLRKWADNCANSHRQFETKVSQLKSMFGELKRRVEDLGLGKASTTIKDLEVMIKGHQKYLNEQRSIMQSLSKDVNTVKKLVDDCLSCQPSASLRPHDAVSALGPMYEGHDKEHLPKMQTCDCSVTKLLDACKNKKNEMNIFVHTFMQKVVYVQSIIRDIRLQLPAFKEAMERQDDFFADLKLVHGIAPAYRACFAEIIRRKSSMKLYMGLAGQLAERLATEREAEVRKREAFLKAQSVYVPRDILASMGLFDSPKQCDVNIVPFDTNLLDIDFAELDRFAPKHLLAGPGKRAKNPVPKGRSLSFNERCDMTQVQENSVNSNEQCQFEELLDGCGSIAGTSKIEVENAWLKAELASAVALICSFSTEAGYETLDDSKMNNLLKNTAEKTAEALQLKDEYGKHLQSMLNMKQIQCLSYEKRIQELEQRLSDQYLHGQKFSVSKDASESAISGQKTDDCKSEVSGDGEGRLPYLSTEPMEDASCTSASVDPKLEQCVGQLDKCVEGVDESMTELSGLANIQTVYPTRNSMDALMMEPSRDDQQVGNKDTEEKMTTEYSLTCTSPKSLVEPLSLLPCGTTAEPGLVTKSSNDLVLNLQKTLTDKSNQYDETETKLKAAMDEIISLRRELEMSQKLLDESQMNCVHLENCLHEAREEAHTNLCAADRRATEYSALRSSAVKMRSIFERFRSCVTASVGVNGFADSLRSLALSLASSASEDDDDGAAEFRACIRVLADKVGFLSRQRTELLDRCSRIEASQGHLIKELEEKKELVKSLYTKHQLEKQANKDKISFGRLEVHELAAFVLNSAGHYEAINRNCSNYFLSTESVALFVEHVPSRPSYIIGQIVHIERQIVRPPASVQAEQADQMDLLSSNPDKGSSPNPFSLPVGCEYFIVTVAMLPDNIHSPSS